MTTPGSSSGLVFRGDQMTMVRNFLRGVIIFFITYYIMVTIIRLFVGSEDSPPKDTQAPRTPPTAAPHMSTAAASHFSPPHAAAPQIIVLQPIYIERPEDHLSSRVSRKKKKKKSSDSSRRQQQHSSETTARLWVEILPEEEE